VVALAFGAQSVISALSSLVLVYNAIFCPWLLGEKIIKKEIFATLLIIGGVVLVVVFGSRSTNTFTLPQLYSQFLQAGPLLYFIVVIIAIASMYLSTKIIPKYRHERDYLNLERGIGRYTAFCYATIPALLSALNVLFAKIISELVEESITGNDQFASFVPYIFLILIIIFSIVQTSILQTALSLFSALFVIPNFQVVVTISSIIGGGIFFCRI